MSLSLLSFFWSFLSCCLEGGGGVGAAVWILVVGVIEAGIIGVSRVGPGKVWNSTVSVSVPGG